LSLRAGLRLDYFDARSTIPSDLQNPANAIAGAPESHPVRTSVKIAVSPRLGIAYPITNMAGVHFAYGHSYQYPPIGQMFANSDYTVLANLQAGDELTRYGVFGNPDVDPEKTVQYEFGYKQALNEAFGYEVTAFYKDIRDLLGVEFIETYTQATYARLTTVDFGSVIGLTLALDHRRLGPASLAVDYTWQLAEGNSSDPSETATRAAAQMDPRPRVIPFDWDQRHTLNLSLTLQKPDRYLLSSIVRAGSGQPYTPRVELTGFALEDNSGRKPAGAIVDLRGEWWFGRRAWRSSIFTRIYNVFDSRYFNGPVFDSTGSPFYSRQPVPIGDQLLLEDPTRFYAPRRIEIGFRFGSI
jgi:outer membrane receptor protein involved in Fe transport